MITSLLACLGAITPVVELPDQSSHEVSIQAIVKLPKLGAKDIAKLEILAQAIPKQTEDYPRREMLIVTGGQPVKCEVTPDVFRIVVNVQPDNLKAGLSLMESLVERASLADGDLELASGELAPRDYWRTALDPVVLQSVKLKQAEALVLYHRVFRPERLLLVVGGKFVPEQAQDMWANRMESWNPGPEPKGYFDITERQEQSVGPGPVSTIVIEGEPIMPSDAALTAKILALYALGSGKGASLFRIVREQHAWSYRQESILSPTPLGWVPKLLVACIPTDDLVGNIEVMKKELTADIKGWTEADRARALGMADAVLNRNVDFSPLYVFGSRPATSSLEDRTFLAGYWQLKTNLAWNPTALLQTMSHVTLADLQSEAEKIVGAGKTRILVGS